MELKLKRARLAFFNGYRPGKPTTDRVTGKVTPGKYGVQGILEIGSPDPAIKAAAQAELQKVIAVITQVAREKWGDKADAVLNSLKAKGDLCLRDGATKSEYEGFGGNVFIAASNASAPSIVAPMLFNGKVVYVAEDGIGYIDGKPVEGQKFKAPYGGCYGNLQFDIWAQDNEYGKRVNAKLLGVQFNSDGLAFSGGAQFDEAGFDYEAESAGDSPWSAAAAPAAGGFSFGAGPATDGFSFGAAPTPAPSPAAATPSAGGFSFSGSSQTSGFSF